MLVIMGEEMVGKIQCFRVNGLVETLGRNFNGWHMFPYGHFLEKVCCFGRKWDMVNQ